MKVIEAGPHTAEVVFNNPDDSTIFYKAVSFDNLRRIQAFEGSGGYAPAAIVPHDVLTQTQFAIYDTATSINRLTSNRQKAQHVGEKAVLISIYFARIANSELA